MIRSMIGLGLLLLTSFTSVSGDGVRLDFHAQMRSRVVTALESDTPLGPYTYSETLLTGRGELRDFKLESREEAELSDSLGAGHAIALTGRSGTVLKRVEIASYPAHPHWLFLRVRYTNVGNTPRTVLGYTSERYEFEPAAGQSEPAS